MRKILIFQWFDCSDSSRKEELTECIQHNISLGFDKVIIFNDSVEPAFFGENIENIQANQRLSYRDFIDVVINPKNYGSLCCLTNTDIKLDKHLFELAAIIKTSDLMCISRYELDGQLARTPWCTQDTWALISQPLQKSIIYQTSIPLGLLGCENRFAEIFYGAGYKVFNPCLDIKNLHLQSIQSAHKNTDRIYGAYLFVPPCHLNDIGKFDSHLIPTPVYLPTFSKKLIRIG